MRMRTLDMKVLSLEQPSARERIPLAVIMSHHEILMLVSWQTAWRIKNKTMIKIDMLSLKGPKHEIFEHGVFNQIKPVRVGGLGTRPKKCKKIMVGALYAKNFEAQ